MNSQLCFIPFEQESLGKQVENKIAIALYTSVFAARKLLQKTVSEIVQYNIVLDCGYLT